MNCPQCDTDLFQSVQLVRLDAKLNAAPVKTVYLCANCGRPIEKPEDFNARKVILHVTGNSEGHRRRAVMQAGFPVEKYLEWHTDPFWADDHNCFITRATYDSGDYAMPDGVVVEIKD
jgi:hypothetical protein